MSSVVLIASGAFVEPELRAEFGNLPPAFLPLGNRRLFVHQRAALGEGVARVVLSLPEEYVVDEADLRLLADLNIEIVPVPGGLSLGQSIVYTINVCALAGSSLSILHGDTLLRPLDLSQLDWVSIDREPPSRYQWGVARTSGEQVEILAGKDLPSEGEAILTGFFNFSNPIFLVQEITRSGGDFLKSLQSYAEKYPLKWKSPSEWFDFGHAGTYHRSRRRVTTEREFNRLSLASRSVVKSGSKPNKIVAEALWFETLPDELRVFTPAYLGRREVAGGPAYALEYLHLPTLSDLAVFGRLRYHAWERIFNACDEFLTACSALKGDCAGVEHYSEALYLHKTLERLQEFATVAGFCLDAPCRFNGKWLPSLNQMANIAFQAIADKVPYGQTLVHGDFCFSNIFYDSHADLVRVIDPRGLSPKGECTSFGDIFYDLGKLYHSAVGRYDQIIAGNYVVKRLGELDFTLEFPESKSSAMVEDVYRNQKFIGLKASDSPAAAIAVLLFLSMIPLHKDDEKRQMALLSNAMRLFLVNDHRLGGE